MKVQIAVIEDEPAVQTLLRDVLQVEGYSVLSFGHGGAAQEILQGYPVDAILVDLMLPDTSGSRVAAWLREHGHARTPMVAMSADHSQLLFARRSGVFDETMRKPFDVDELLDLVEALTSTQDVKSIG